MTDTKIPLDLLAAYQESVFHVYAEPPFTLHVSKNNQLADALLESFIAKSGVVITACNPFSELLSDDANQKLNSALEQDLNAAGYTIFKALGQDKKAEWPGEPSFFVIGMDKNTALSLAKRHQQNAIVWHEKDCASELLLTR